VQTYCDLPILYRFMRQADAQMGRKLPGLVKRCGFALVDVRPHVTVETSLTGAAARRIEEMAWSVRRAIRLQQAGLTEHEVQQWLDGLLEQDAKSDFFFSENVSEMGCGAPPTFTSMC